MNFFFACASFLGFKNWTIHTVLRNIAGGTTRFPFDFCLRGMQHSLHNCRLSEVRFGHKGAPCPLSIAEARSERSRQMSSLWEWWGGWQQRGIGFVDLRYMAPQMHAPCNAKLWYPQPFFVTADRDICIFFFCDYMVELRYLGEVGAFSLTFAKQKQSKKYKLQILFT